VDKALSLRLAWRGWIGAWLLPALAMLGGCASTHYDINAPLAQVSIHSGYRPQVVFEQSPDDRFFMLLTFSGGGARAAALGFGVLEALRDTPIVWEGKTQTLLDQVDIVSGVSGGSILAASFALHGVAGMVNFENKFLKGEFQSRLVSQLAAPSNWWRLSSPRFGRSELLQEILDDTLFQGAKYGDLLRAGRKPYLSLYASDLGTGGRFEFSQDHFDYLCSDVASVPLSRAVAASSAAPLVLSPVTLWNYAPALGQTGCGDPAYRQFSQLANAGAKSIVAPGPDQGRARSSTLERYRDANTQGPLRPFVHLLDGGLSDNIGTGGPLDFGAQFGGVIAGTRFSGFRQLRHSVLIIVNAETSARSPEDQSADVPGLLRAALALADIPINRNSNTALDQMRSTIAAWQAEVSAAHAKGDFEVFAADGQLHLIEVSLSAEPDAAEREKLLAIPTNLQLPADDVQRLRSYGAQTLRKHPVFQKLLRELAAPATSRSASD
jgi:NTE family protein